jgi:hypothetical protein
MRMKFSFASLAAGAFILGAIATFSATPASAVPIHIVASGSDLQGNPFSFDGMFDATSTSSGYDLTSVSGGEDAYISGVLEHATIVGLSPYAGADNTLSSNLLPDFGGFSFSTDVAGDTNIFTTCGTGPCAIKSADDPVGYPSSGFELAYSANVVPEPVTLSLFGAGLAGAAALRRRKKAKA